MADNSKGKREDEIRIVEDPVDEVVRLDVAKVEPLEKKGKMASVVMSPVGETGQDIVSEKQSFDPETDWIEDEEQKGKLEVPIGWFVLLVAGLLGVLIWVFFQTKSKDIETADLGTKPNESESVDLARSPDSVSSPVNEIEDARAEEHFVRMEEVVANFLSAKTFEEKAKFVRHPKRVLPLMKRYYETHEFTPLTFKDTHEYHIVSLSNRPFIALMVEVEEGSKVPVLLEDLPGGMLVDWESFVCYQPVAPEEYIEGRPTETYSLRVYAERDEFFTYEFSDEDKYECYRLTFRNSDVIMYGFVEKGGVTAREIASMVSPGRRGVKIPVILKVRFIEDGKARRSVLIEDLESKLWAFPTNPDEAGSQGSLK